MIKLNFKPNYENKACNYCGMFEFKILSKKDRYGLLVETVICKKCGLIFINPIMDKNSYEKFYQGSYRGIIQEYKNRKEENWNLEKNFVAAKKLGVSFAQQFKDYIGSGSMVEVGSSCGGVLAGFKEINKDLNVLGIEPSNIEANFAISKGIKTYTGLMENFKSDMPKANNILIVRSLNHLLDPKQFFLWANNQLYMGGRLIIVVINFLNLCERKGKIFSQIDHPFMFSQYTLKNFIKSAGFNVVFEDYSTRPDYLMLVAEKINKASFVDIKINNLVYENTLKKLSWKSLFLSKIKNKFSL